MDQKVTTPRQQGKRKSAIFCLTAGQACARMTMWRIVYSRLNHIGGLRNDYNENETTRKKVLCEIAQRGFSSSSYWAVQVLSLCEIVQPLRELDNRESGLEGDKKMQKISKEHYFELAVFLMDYYSGQWSRGYRLLCRLKPSNFSSRLCDELRDTEIYQYLVDNYASKV